MIVTLPWPDRRLSPNSRAHWRARMKPKQDARTAAEVATMAAEGFHATKAALAASKGLVALIVRFYPPDRRHRDDDNMVGSFKAARDGIAAALEVDDRRFRPHYFFEDPCKPGRIEVEFPAPSDRASEDRESRA